MLRVLLLLSLLVAVSLAAALAVRDLVPPATLRFAAGSEGGGYWRIAERYRDILVEDGITMELVATAGSVENAALLDQRQVDAGFLQGGVSPASEAAALASVFIEPILVFAHQQGDAAVPPNIGQWRGLAVAAGAEGSGTRAAMRSLLRAAEVEPGANELVPLGGAEAAAALIDRSIDAAVFVAPLSAPYLAPLIEAEDVVLVALAHEEALARRMPQAVVATVPSGTFRIAPPLPPVDRELLALVARVVAVPDLHPALVDRLVEAAVAVHGPGDRLSPEGTYPSAARTTLPLHPYARDRLEDGPSALTGLLPFWAVAQVERLAILMVPVLLLALPLLRALPGLYSWGLRSRVYRHYARIREIDAELAEGPGVAQLARLDRELAEIDAALAAVRLPLAYRGLAYEARVHVDLLRRRMAVVDE
jgi:TRAP-type uncharacterized transport system substrate-binding protein